MKKQNIVLLFGFITILVIAGVICYLRCYKSSVSPAGQIKDIPKSVIANFEECAAAGNPVMESYPRRCNANGQIFIEDIGNELEKNDLIKIDSPRPNAVVTSPLEVTGQARGFWYFEASFPVKLFDGNGREIPLNPPYIMTAKDWMTEEFVPFKATLEFTAPITATGTLILEKDNPSGLPEHDDSLIVPVKFR